MILALFLDLLLDQLLYSPQDWYGRLFAVIGPLPGLVVMSFGGLLLVYLCSNHRWYIRTASWIVFIVLLGGGTWFFGHAASESLGFRPWFALLMGALILAGCDLVLLFCVRGSDVQKLWRLTWFLLFVSVGTFATVNLIKEFWNRPRYYAIASDPAILFRSWLQPQLTSASVLGDRYGLPADAFKSFPSGHTACAAIGLSLYALSACIPSWKGKGDIVISIAMLWTVLTAFSRMILGMHFLSDVTASLLIFLLFIWMADRFAAVRSKKKSRSRKDNTE